MSSLSWFQIARPTSLFLALAVALPPTTQAQPDDGDNFGAALAPLGDFDGDCAPSLICAQEATPQTLHTNARQVSGNEMPVGDPGLIVSDMSLSDASFGDGDGFLEEGEVAEVTLTLTNAGDMPVNNGTLSAEWTAGNGDFEWIVGDVTVDRILPGHSSQLPPLSFQVNTAEQFSIGTYVLTYSQFQVTQGVSELTVYANPLDYTTLQITGHHTWNQRRDDRYLAYIDRSPIPRLWVKDLETGDVQEVVPNTSGFRYMVIHEGWLAYTSVSGTYHSTATLRLADAATGEVSDIASGSEGYDVDSNIRPALSDQYLVWRGTGYGVLDGVNLDHALGGGWDADIFADYVNGPPLETQAYLRVMKRENGRHRRLGSGDGIYEWSPAVAGELAVYIRDFTVHLQNLTTGADITLSDPHPQDHAFRVGIGEEHAVWTTLNRGLVIRELSTGDELELAFPEGVTVEGAMEEPIEVGDGWAALSGDYFGTHHLFLIRLSDGAFVPVAREWPYDQYSTASLYGKRLLYTWVSAIREEVLPVAERTTSTATDVGGITSELGNRAEVQTALADAIGVTNNVEDKGTDLALATNVPNPFSEATRIDYVVDRAGTVDLAVYDVSGRLVRTLVHRTSTPGQHSTRWDGTDDGGAHVTAGVYFYRLTVEGRSITRSALLLR